MRTKKHRTVVIIPPRAGRIKSLRVRISFLVFLSALMLVGFAGYFIPFNSFSLDIVEENQKKNLAAQNVKLLHRIRSIRTSLSRLRKEVAFLEERKSDIENLTRSGKTRQAAKNMGNEKKEEKLTLERVMVLAQKNEKSIQHFADRLSKDPRFLEKIPVAKPVSGSIHLGMKFGQAKDPFTNKIKMHHGLDFVAEKGAPVFATASGVVKRTENHRAWGLRVVIDHDFGFSTVYAHLESIKTVRGRRVKKGDIIGTVGASGISVGPRLHYEIRRHGKSVDPEKYMFPEFSDTTDIVVASAKNIE
ncbi:MAG: peptidoglycan DD-metalloendopeptidase family protein [Chitinivibrionales bacterium]|nr:peptidoglycan DD-metalloendopeptidase family protein [Chitinivibrionales bacterium]